MVNHIEFKLTSLLFTFLKIQDWIKDFKKTLILIDTYKM